MDGTRKRPRQSAAAVYVCTDPDLETLTGRDWLNEWWRRENRPPIRIDITGRVLLSTGGTAPWWRASCRACVVGASADMFGSVIFAHIDHATTVNAGLDHLRERHTCTYAVDPR